MKTKARALRIEVIKLEISALSKVIDGYEALTKALNECYSNLEDLNSNLFNISTLPRDYEIIDKMHELLRIRGRLRDNALEAGERLNKAEAEYYTLEEEEEDE